MFFVELHNFVASTTSTQWFNSDRFLHFYLATLNIILKYFQNKFQVIQCQRLKFLRVKTKIRQNCDFQPLSGKMEVLDSLVQDRTGLINVFFFTHYLEGPV